MPAFRYEAVDAGGATNQGVLNSDSARSARSELRTLGLVPLKVDAIAAQVDAAGVAKSRGLGERLSTTEQIRAQIHNRASEAEVRAAAQRSGMLTMREDGERWLADGTTTQAELLRVAKD